MSVTASHDSALLDQVVELIRQGVAPLEACRQAGLSFHAYGPLVAERPDLARELDRLREERDLARQRAYRERMRLAKPALRLVALPVSTEATYCGQCGGPAALVGSGGTVRCPDCGDSAAASGALAYCTLDGQRMATHRRCGACTQLRGEQHCHPDDVCLPLEQRRERRRLEGATA